MKKLLAILSAVILSTNISANDTGAWFDPSQDGHGISLHEWDNNRLFWWYTYHPVFGQVWLLSSVEVGNDFVLYRPRASDFPTANDFTIGEPVGTASLVKVVDGSLVFIWDLLIEEVTCEDKYGPVPPGPRDPACLDEDNNFVPDRVLVEGGFDYQGTARFIRLTPGD